MPMEETVVTLASIGDGAALELFDRELHRVVANIADPNTSATSKRVINIRVTIQPDEDRDIGEAFVEVTAKLAHAKPAKSKLYFGKKDGKLVAVESNPKQSSIFDSPEKRNEMLKVVPLSEAKGAQQL